MNSMGSVAATWMASGVIALWTRSTELSLLWLRIDFELRK
jgi:hypothetical protein